MNREKISFFVMGIVYLFFVYINFCEFDKMQVPKEN